MFFVSGTAEISMIKQIVTKTGKPMTACVMKPTDRNSRGRWGAVAFDERAMMLAEIREGQSVSFKGTLQINTWEKDGVKRYDTQIVINEIQTERMTL